MTIVTPERTTDQRLDALQHANRVRTRRAELKRELRVKPSTVVDVVRNPPEWVLTMKVQDLLMAVPKFGRVKVQKIMRACELSESKTVGGLSSRQRVRLAIDLMRRLG